MKGDVNNDFLGGRFIGIALRFDGEDFGVLKIECIGKKDSESEGNWDMHWKKGLIYSMSYAYILSCYLYLTKYWKQQDPITVFREKDSV